MATALRYGGYEVSVKQPRNAGLAAAWDSRPDLIVLDVMLPDIDGFEIARRIRADGLPIPILFLTAKDGLRPPVCGFSVGADDYVTKPFSLAEIVVRVRAIIQRAHGALPSASRQLMYADVVLDPDTHEVWRNGTTVELAAQEFGTKVLSHAFN